MKKRGDRKTIKMSEIVDEKIKYRADELTVIIMRFKSSQVLISAKSSKIKLIED